MRDRASRDSPQPHSSHQRAVAAADGPPNPAASPATVQKSHNIPQFPNSPIHDGAAPHGTARLKFVGGK